MGVLGLIGSWAFRDYESTDGSGSDDADDEYDFQVPDRYDFYVVEIAESKTPQRDQLYSVVNMAELGSVPDEVAHVRFRNSALSALCDLYGYSGYPEESPVLLITDTVPREYDDDTDVIVVRLGNYSPDRVSHILNDIYRNLEAEEFARIRWDERVRRLRESLPDPVGGVGTAASIVGLL
jgi:hypothetical protein